MEMATNSGLPKDAIEADGMTMLVFVVACIITLASMAMNIVFAGMVAYGTLAFVLYGMIYLGSDMFKVAAPSLARYFWLRSNPFIAATITIALIATTTLSWIAGTGFLSGTTTETEKVRLQHSPRYQHNIEAQQRLQAEAEAIAVSPAAEQAARDELSRLQQKWEKAYAPRSQFFTRDYTPKHVRNTSDTWHERTAKEVAEVMKPIDDAIAQQQAIIDRAEAYKAKVAEIERLQSIQPNAINAESGLPVFNTLGQYFGIPYDAARVRVFVLTSLISELVSSLCWLIWGMMRKPRQLTMAELSRANLEHQAHAELMARTFAQMGMSIPPAGATPSVPSTPSGSDDGQARGPAPTTIPIHETDDWGEIDERGMREVGKRYRCTEDGCENTYICRAIHQKRCPSCRRKIEDKFRSGKSIKSGGNQP